MKILHVITTLDVGGAEMHLLAQVRGQAARGHAPSVAYLKGGGRLADDFRAAGARSVERVGASLLGLRSRARAAELVHSHLLKADMACALAAPFSGRPLVSSKHNDEQVLKKPLVSFVHGRLGNVPRRTIVLSDHVGRFFERYGGVRPESIRRVYYGIDPAPFEGAARMTRARRAELRAPFGFGPEDRVFVCVARFAPQKAHAVLLRGFARALRESADGPPLRLLLVGDDPYGSGRADAERVAGELGLAGRAVFAGIRRDVPELLAASDVFVMTSLWEGLGLVFLEAMAAGIPVLATRVSAVPEVVVEGETGLLVPPSDEAALAAEMLRLARDPELCARLGRAGRERVRARFGLDRMVDETLGVYREALSGR